MIFRLAFNPSQWVGGTTGLSRLWLRRNYEYAYKPKEKNRLRENLEVLARKDLTLFYFENPKRMTLFTGMAALMTPMWLYLGYFTYTLPTQLDPYRDRLSNENRKPAWVLNNIDKASRGVALGFSLFGLILSAYWLSRSRHTCGAVHQNYQGKQRTYIRVKDYYFKFQLNVENGTFVNRPLFDRTVGIARRV
eukprot:maker-scaffold292_size219010-snap-gene-1.39 protein:Tk00328 transcript:maker-scaffold292_size219010-snap-gene-1.39-mRNA-1 annotation:"carbamoyl phosphate synthase large subunit"